MNTHPTHTRVWVGWGLRPLIVPIGVDVFFVVVCVIPSTPWRRGGCFWCISVFFVRFLERWCVCGRCFFVLSNIVNYRKNFLYSSTNCDSKNASPILVENPRSLRGSLKNYYPVAEKNVASFKDQREYLINYK